MIRQLLNPDNYRLTFYSLPPLVTGGAIVALGIFVLLRERGSRLGITFWLFTLCIGFWLLVTGINYASVSESLSSWLVRVIQIAVVCIPTAAVTLAVTIVQRRYQYRILVRSFMVLSLLFCIGVALTNLFYKGLYHYPWGYYARYGILGAIFLLFFGVAAILNIYLFWQEYRLSTTERHRKRLKGLLWAFSIGYFGAVDFVDTFGIPVYPFGYIPVFCFIGIASWVIVRYRLVDITPELAANQILETMQSAVIVVDLEDRIRVVNRTAMEMFGCQTIEDVLGSHLSSILMIPDAVIGAVRAGKRPGPLEMVWPCRDGRQTIVSVSASPIADKGNKSPVGIVYVAHDITERKRAEEQMHQTNKELQDFAYIVSHDLRAPLVNIRGFSEELGRSLAQIGPCFEKHQAALDEEEKKQIRPLIREDIPEALGFIRSSVARMDSQINAILKLSRAGRRKLSPEPLKTGELVRGILKTLTHQLESRNVAATVGLLPDIIADRMAMEQIFGNLLDNAVKYLNPSRPGEIAVTAELGERETVFHVRDNGRGIAAEDIPKSFEIFRRVGRQDVPGEGLGLAYVKVLVRGMGGRIWCESKPGTGSVFSFALPHAWALAERTLHERGAA
jgi:PAS domain S-box-containing protein